MERKEFDVIVMLEGHGCYNTKSAGEIRLCNMVGVPRGMEATFLEAVPCGVTNFSNLDWGDTTSATCRAILETTGPRQEFAVEIQKYLKNEKQKYIYERTHPILKQEKAKGTVDPILKDMADFARVEGWEMHTYKKQYPDRSYTVTPTVIYPQDLPLYEIKTRSMLLDALSRLGFTNPLIIDNTCGGVDADSPTGARHAARMAKPYSSGGRKTRRRKLTKRPKVKKLIHFA